jgi:hypothetical protein
MLSVHLSNVVTIAIIRMLKHPFHIQLPYARTTQYVTAQLHKGTGRDFRPSSFHQRTLKTSLIYWLNPFPILHTVHTFKFAEIFSSQVAKIVIFFLVEPFGFEQLSMNYQTAESKSPSLRSLH